MEAARSQIPGAAATLSSSLLPLQGWGAPEQEVSELDFDRTLPATIFPMRAATFLASASKATP